MDEELVKRLDRIEAKLDSHLAQLAKHDADLTWVRGYVKTSITSIISLTIGLIITFFKTLKA